MKINARFMGGGRKLNLFKIVASREQGTHICIKTFQYYFECMLYARHIPLSSHDLNC